MIQVNRIYLIFNRLVTKKFLVDTSDLLCCMIANPISFFLAHKKNRSFAALDEKGKVI